MSRSACLMNEWVIFNDFIPNEIISKYTFVSLIFFIIYEKPKMNITQNNSTQKIERKRKYAKTIQTEKSHHTICLQRKKISSESYLFSDPHIRFS